MTENTITKKLTNINFMPKSQFDTITAEDDTQIYAVETDIVETTGNQTIDGVKTFSSSPQVPTPVTSANSNEIANCEWVNNVILKQVPDYSKTTSISTGIIYKANTNVYIWTIKSGNVSGSYANIKLSLCDESGTVIQTLIESNSGYEGGLSSSSIIIPSGQYFLLENASYMNTYQAPIGISQ